MPAPGGHPASFAKKNLDSRLRGNDSIQEKRLDFSNKLQLMSLSESDSCEIRKKPEPRKQIWKK
jgi:hypothetical protein